MVKFKQQDIYQICLHDIIKLRTNEELTQGNVRDKTIYK